MRATAIRSILAAVIIGTLLILLKHVIVDGLILAYWIRVEDGEVREAARMYIFARLWGAPFALGNYAVGGFLNGMAKVQLVLQLQILLNSLNCLLCVGFAFGLGLGVEGIGWAAALANLKAVGVEPDHNTLDIITSLIAKLQDSVADLVGLLDTHCKSMEAECEHMRDAVLPKMLEVREAVDTLEGYVPTDVWPLPTYQDMLFIK